MPTLIAISVIVTVPCRPAELRWRFRTTFFAGPRATPAWSGQRIPTGLKVMQSGQMPRPHSEHETPVSRSGCR